MLDNTSFVTVGDVAVQVVHKNIKSIRLVVKPPDGAARLSVPLGFPDDEIRSLLARRLDWIKRHQQALRQRPRQKIPCYKTGECHYYLGRPYQLYVREQSVRHRLTLEDQQVMTLHVRAGTTTINKARVMHSWYRTRLDELIAGLVKQWSPVIGQSINSWQIKRMKTRWGSCNITHRRITINLELAKRPIECLELVVVHELVHLHERYHNARFRRLMDKYLPDWRQRQSLLDGIDLSL